MRLYPTGLKTATRMSFTATLEALPQVMNRGWCQTWVELNGELYGGVGVDEFVFGFEEGGEVVWVEWSALRERLVRIG